MSDAQTNWENKRASDCAEHNQPKCPKFPDHDCVECHSAHREWSEFNKFCDLCADEKCQMCYGEGVTVAPKKTRDPFYKLKAEETCRECEGTGRIQT